MSPYFHRWLLSVFAILMVGSVGIAQEPAAETESEPAAEKTYHDLRRSKDHTTRRFAERYSLLVRTQEWTSANGKSKVMARYVSHTPDLKQVTLAVVKGSGANRVVQEKTVQVAQLNKACQSRIKQIDIIKKKLDELAAKEEEEDENQPGAEGSGYGEYGAPMLDERGTEPAATEEMPESDPAASERGRDAYGGYDAYSSGAAPAAGETAPAAPPAGSSDPDPLGFGEIVNEAPAAASPGAAAASGGTTSFFGPFAPASASSAAGSGPAAGEPGRIDPSQWKTSYAAFHANFTATPSGSGEPTIDWGHVGELKAMHDAIVASEQQGINNDYGQVTAEGTQRIGEVSWEGVFLGLQQNRETGEQDLQFDVPPLPEPLKIRFVASDSIETWAATRPGQSVKFIGRLNVKKPQEVLVQVRRAE